MSKVPNSNYMGSGLAQTLAEKPNNNKLAGMNNGLLAAASATSLTLSNYAVPSLDGKLLPAIPLHLALKYKPPTIAVVYIMKDNKSRVQLDKKGRQKKYIHEIKIDFDKETQGVNIGRMCEEICARETVYLNASFIGVQQVIELLEKLHKNYLQQQESKAPQASGAPDSGEKPQQESGLPQGRKPNFFDRKRFVDYAIEQDDQQQDSAREDANKDASEPKEVKTTTVVASQGAPDAVEEEVVQVQSKKRPKAEAARSAPPKKKQEEKEIKPVEQAVKPAEAKVEELRKNKKVDNDFALELEDASDDDWDKPQEKKKKQKSEKSEEYEDDNWDLDDQDLGLQDNKAAEKAKPKVPEPAVTTKPVEKVVQKPAEVKKSAIPPKEEVAQSKPKEQPKQNIDFFGTNLDDHSEIKNKRDSKGSNEDQFGDGNFFGNDFGDLENDYNNEQAQQQNDFGMRNAAAASGEADKKGNNPFGQSITKELLQQSRKEIADELAGHGEDEDFRQDAAEAAQTKKKNLAALQIEIDENSDYEAQNNQAQQNLNDKLIQNQKQTMMEDEGEEEEEEAIHESQILEEFDTLYNGDPELKQMLGEFPERYSLEEKCSIVQAYKKGGGVQGLADIIDDEDDSEEDQQMAGAQGVQGGNGDDRQLIVDGMMQGEDDDDEEEVDIDLEDPEDVKVIEMEFQKLYDKDEDFKTNFGEEAFELGPLQKYQIIDAYNKNGMQAVLALLTTSANESGILNQLDPQDQQNISDMDMMGQEEESMIEHEGKKYSRIQITGLGDDEVYLMDEKGGIYSLDFKFITNMEDNKIEIDDD